MASAAVLGTVAFLATRNVLIDLAIVIAYALFLLSRPRVKRVVARLKDDPSWRAYYRN
jgi:hypothetical protein